MENFIILLNMKIEEVVFILENRIKSLQQQRDSAVMSGNLESVNLIDIQLIETNNTLMALKITLQSVQLPTESSS